MIFRATSFSSISPFQILGYVTISLALSCQSHALAHWPSIELHALSRLGGSIGTNFEVSVAAGVHFEEVDRLTFSTQELLATLVSVSSTPYRDEPSIGTGRFQVSIPATAVEGFIEARVQGRFGLSNSRRFWITKEPWQVEPWRLTSPTNAADLKPNVIRQDRFEPKYRNYYRLDVDSPKTVQLAILTSILDSQAELEVILLGPDGRKVMPLDSGTHNLGWSWKLLQAGPHTLVLNDRLFRGGLDYAYALVWKDFLELESNSLLDRWSVVTSQRPPVTIAPDDRARSKPEPMRPHFTTLSSSNLSPKTLTLRPPCLDAQRIQHSESDYPKNQPCSAQIPALIEGVFDFNLDEDWFEVELAENESIVAEVVSERMGERTDPVMAAYSVSQDEAKNETLKLIVRADDLEVSNDPMSFSSRDPIAIIKATRGGKYRILVRDQQRMSIGMARSRYVLELRKPKPGFQLMTYWAYPGRDRTKAKTVSPTIIENGALALAMRAYRYDGWSGPIEIRVENIPDAFKPKTTLLAAQQSLGHCIFEGTKNAFDVIPNLEVIGSAKIEEQQTERTATSFEYIWGPSETYRAPIVRLVDSLPIAVESRDQLPIKVQLGSDSNSTIARGSNGKIPIKAERTENAKQLVTVRLVDLPSSAKSKDVKIEPDQFEGEVEISIAEATPVGDYVIWAQCETKVTMPTNLQSLDRAKQQLSKLELLQKETPDNEEAEIAAAIKSLNEQISSLQESSKPKSYDIQLPSNQFLIHVVEKQ